jgi:ribosomal-protein-alanine N-acetyltransferase
MAHSYPDPPGGRHPGWPAHPGTLTVRAGAVALRPVRLRDAGAWSAIRTRDEKHLAPWEPTMPGGWARRNAPAEWPGRWLQLRSAARRGQALPFAVTLDGRFVGHVMVGNVLREPLLSAYVGYWVDSAVTGAGVITAAVALVIDHCFDMAGLHRLEATVRPENGPSIRVLEKLGFRQEGLFRRYLEIEGAWRDHLCYATTADEQPPGGRVGRLVAEGRATRV